MSDQSTSALAADQEHVDPDMVEARIERAFELINPDTPSAHALALDALADAEPHSFTAGRAHHAVGLSAALLGRQDLAGEHLQQATGVLAQFGVSIAALRAWRDYGAVSAFVIGDLHTGLDALEQALEVCRDLDDEREEGMLLSRMGAVLGHAGRPDEARQLLERAKDILAKDSDREAYAGALSNLGHSCLLVGDYERAVALFREERSLHREDTARLRVANCEANLANALAGIGDASGAIAALEQARLLLNPQTDGHQWVDFLLASGRVALLNNTPADALTPLEDGLHAARSQGLQRIEIELLTALAQAQELTNDLANALQSERDMRAAERRWLDEQSAAQLRTMETELELVRERAEREALQKAQAELEERVEARTAELQVQMREREAAEEMARFWADHDWLTRLPNRRQLKAELAAMLAEAKRRNTQLGVLFIDLDGFKEVNDSHGHMVGDHMLRETARRLEQSASEGAVVTRFGGDEFVILLPNLSTSEEVISTAQDLRNAVLQPMDVEGRTISPSCSIGVSVGPRDASSAEELLRRADQAMLEAKTTGRNRVLELDARGQARLDRRTWIRRELNACIDDGRLTAVYQPIWDIRTRELHGLELLARLNDPKFGSIPPADFIPLAEETGLISRLGLWAVTQASHAARSLQREARASIAEKFQIGVNLSSAQLSSDTLVSDLVNAVVESGGEISWLQLELTESRELAEDPAIRQRLIDLRARGFTLAIDDFGAGYSSFSYLSTDFFDRLKIDRGLVESAAESTNKSAVIGSIVAMSRHLGLDVVGEGVETKAQLDLLVAAGCHAMQGYHIARPMPLESIIQWSGPAES